MTGLCTGSGFRGQCAGPNRTRPRSSMQRWSCVGTTCSTHRELCHAPCTRLAPCAVCNEQSPEQHMLHGVHRVGPRLTGSTLDQMIGFIGWIQTMGYIFDTPALEDKRLLLLPAMESSWSGVLGGTFACFLEYYVDASVVWWCQPCCYLLKYQFLVCWSSKVTLRETLQLLENKIKLLGLWRDPVESAGWNSLFNGNCSSNFLTDLMGNSNYSPEPETALNEFCYFCLPLSLLNGADNILLHTVDWRTKSRTFTQQQYDRGGSSVKQSNDSDKVNSSRQFVTDFHNSREAGQEQSERAELSQ